MGKRWIGFGLLVSLVFGLAAVGYGMGMAPGKAGAQAAFGVIRTIPKNGAMNVGLNPEIRVVFNRGAQISTRIKVNISPGGNLGLGGGGYVYYDTLRILYGGGSRRVWAWLPEDYPPLRGLSSNTTYTCTVTGAEGDPDGTKLPNNRYTFSFTTGSETQPISLLSPGTEPIPEGDAINFEDENTPLVLTFNKEIKWIDVASRRAEPPYGIGEDLKTFTFPASIFPIRTILWRIDVYDFEGQSKIYFIKFPETTTTTTLRPTTTTTLRPTTTTTIPGVPRVTTRFTVRGDVKLMDPTIGQIVTRANVPISGAKVEAKLIQYERKRIGAGTMTIPKVIDEQWAYTDTNDGTAALNLFPNKTYDYTVSKEYYNPARGKVSTPRELVNVTLKLK